MKGRTTIAVISCVLLLAVIVSVPNVTAQEVVIPSWIKNNAGWWASDQIPDSAFLQGIQHLIKEGIMVIPSTETSESSGPQEVPSWVKNNAGWWADGQINDNTFVSGIQHLIKSGIIVVTQAEKSVTETTVKVSGYPDWLINNPSWEAAREFCNCPFDKFDLSYLKENVKTCDDCESKTIINSYGFRGEEFSEQKPENTYRIFALGGSSTFGLGVYDDESWPVYLQKKFDKIDLGVDVEIINAGINAANSGTERKLIEEQIVNFDPDLIIMYDGWNDAGYPISWNRPSPSMNESMQNWTAVCELGKEKGFDTIITIQSIVGTGERVLSDHELKFLVNRTFDIDELHRKLGHYAEYLPELNKVCTKAVDFTGIFDYTQEQVYVDWGHPSSKGHEIIAENMFVYALPIVLEKTNTTYETESAKYAYNSGQFTIFAAGADLSGKNFGTMDLSNAIFDNADLSYANFDDATLKEARFTQANLSYVDLAGKDLKGSILVRVDLSDTKLVGTDLSFANLADANLQESDLTGTKLVGANLRHTNLEGANVKNTDFTNANFTYANLVGTNLKDAKVDDAKFTGVKFDGFDISLGSLLKINFSDTDISEAILTNTDLSDKDLSHAILSGQDLSGHDITNTILSGADLTDVTLPDTGLSGKNFEYTTFDGVDLSGKDLSSSNFQYASFNNADLRNVDFSSSFLIQVDFTKIKNKSLAGAYFRDTSFAHSNLSGVNLTGVTLDNNNFYQATLSGLDFTVISNGLIKGATFSEADLSNSNFEGVSLFDDRIYIATATGQAQKVDRSFYELTREFFPDYKNRWVVGLQAIGNDLLVQFIFFNNFNNATLQNVNFSNADLRYASFGNADLTTANLENCVGHLICD